MTSAESQPPQMSQMPPSQMPPSHMPPSHMPPPQQNISSRSSPFPPQGHGITPPQTSTPQHAFTHTPGFPNMDPAVAHQYRQDVLEGGFTGMMSSAPPPPPLQPRVPSATVTSPPPMAAMSESQLMAQGMGVNSSLLDLDAFNSRRSSEGQSRRSSNPMSPSGLAGLPSRRPEQEQDDDE